MNAAIDTERMFTDGTETFCQKRPIENKILDTAKRMLQGAFYPPYNPGRRRILLDTAIVTLAASVTGAEAIGAFTRHFSQSIKDETSHLEEDYKEIVLSYPLGDFIQPVDGGFKTVKTVETVEFRALPADGGKVPFYENVPSFESKNKIEKNADELQNVLHGKRVAGMFYEASNNTDGINPGDIHITNLVSEPVGRFGEWILVTDMHGNFDSKNPTYIPGAYAQVLKPDLNQPEPQATTSGIHK